MDKIAFFILNIFLNSFLAFLTAVLLIEGLLFLFRVPQGRAAAILRMIPILKLPIDLFLYDFSKWSYGQGINPLNCAEGTRELTAMCGLGVDKGWPLLFTNSSIQLTVFKDWTFTIADVVGYSVDSLVVKVFAWVFVVFTFGMALRRLYHYYRSWIALDSLLQNSKPLCKKMRNSTLQSFMETCGVQILTSPTHKGSPFVAGLTSSTIYIPTDLVKHLSRREYEAVLAHEMEHVRYKDSLVRLFLDFIGSIFWWIPTKWLRHRIETGQEIGCDRKCEAYGINMSVLASAICKSAKYSIANSKQFFAHHLTKHAVLKRVQVLLQPTSTRFKKTRRMLTCLAIGIAFSIILLGRFWVF